MICLLNHRYLDFRKHPQFILFVLPAGFPNQIPYYKGFLVFVNARARSFQAPPGVC